MKKPMLMALLLAVSLAAAPREKAEGATAFRDVNLLPMTGNVVQPHQTVLVREGKILQVGDSRRIAVPKGARVIDGRGKYLMPGLADMHVHSGTRDWETPDYNLFLANGVTTMRDLTQGGPVSSIKTWCADFNGKKRLGPTIYNAWTVWCWPRLPATPRASLPG
jgi:hypothetical protein